MVYRHFRAAGHALIASLMGMLVYFVVFLLVLFMRWLTNRFDTNPRAAKTLGDLGDLHTAFLVDAHYGFLFILVLAAVGYSYGLKYP